MMHIKQLYISGLTVFCALLLSSSVMAFSMSPEADKPYSPANWETSESAVDDAKIAVENDDFRLLGFALRGYSVPGIDNKSTQDYIDRCGIRVFDEFGDVLKEKNQLERMGQARDYARAYNQIIKEHCSLQ